MIQTGLNITVVYKGFNIKAAQVKYLSRQKNTVLLHSVYKIFIIMESLLYRCLKFFMTHQ